MIRIAGEMMAGIVSRFSALRKKYQDTIVGRRLFFSALRNFCHPYATRSLLIQAYKPGLNLTIHFVPSLICSGGLSRNLLPEPNE